MATAPVLLDDLYRGPRWRYGLPARHLVHYLDDGAIDWILFSERPSDDPRLPFGTVDFPRELSDSEIASRELIVLGKII